MAFGTAKGGGEYKFAKLLGMRKTDPEPYFEIDGEQGNYIEGYLERTELSSYEFEGKDRKVFNLYLVDGEEKYKLSMSYTRTSRSIINALSSIPKFEKKVRIQMYAQNKEDKVYKNASVYHGGERFDWKYSRDEQKDMVRVVNDPDTGEYLKTDYSKLDEKFNQELDDMNKRIDIPEQKTADDILEGEEEMPF